MTLKIVKIIGSFNSRNILEFGIDFFSELILFMLQKGRYYHRGRAQTQLTVGKHLERQQLAVHRWEIRKKKMELGERRRVHKVIFRYYFLPWKMYSGVIDLIRKKNKN